ncbi:FunK1 protein kinase [Xylariaceae sp. FL1019]|nr:FunK1 protein kinase [Xylariaceae sp. FL1019]
MARHLAAYCEDQRDLTTEDILSNIDGRMHGPMSGFIQKYFGHFQYSYEDSCLKIHDSTNAFTQYTIPTLAPSPDRFVTWFTEVVAGAQTSARCSWRVKTVPALESAQFFLSVPSDSTTRDELHSLGTDINVVGHFHQQQDAPYQEGLVDLRRSAQMVFASQPTRLFLHGLYIRGSLAELWLFDRSGLYCSDVIHIERDFTKFISLLFSYQHMTDEELGRSHLIQTDATGTYVRLRDMGQVYIDPQPIACRDGLVGGGMSCFRARRPDSDLWTHVIKFKWRWARRRPENELLLLAKDRGARGAVSVDHYEEFEDTAYLRRGLRWGPYRRFKRSSTTNDNDAPREPQRERGFVECTEDTEEFFRKLILTCIMTSPVGRPLCSYKSLTELLEAISGAIKCHRSLYQDAGVLHQDVSPGNIIIIDSKDAIHADGILIDLDVAVELDSDANFEKGITGTPPFMAIGALKGELRTYRHDLESFFYVLLWVVISKDEENAPASSRLCRWGRSDLDYDDLARYKSHDMQEGLPAIMKEMSPEYDALKPLVEKLHLLLFTPNGEDLWTGTDPSPASRNRLYDEMVESFEEAIARVDAS